eukprot:scaffold35277_cov59-Phaeocystis_antarctica.AAC.1
MVSGKKEISAVRVSSSYWHTRAQFRERSTLQMRQRPFLRSSTSSSSAPDAPMGYPAPAMCRLTICALISGSGSSCMSSKVQPRSAVEIRANASA